MPMDSMRHGMCMCGFVHLCAHLSFKPVMGIIGTMQTAVMNHLSKKRYPPDIT